MYALEETAEEFHTTFDTTKAAWEKKNHQFGERELCRVGLDVFLVMNNRTLTPEEEEIANKILKDEEKRDNLRAKKIKGDFLNKF